jgi:phenylpyruvate tautomerase PptA (4-oxalocrotonate tautomerase family)
MPTYVCAIPPKTLNNDQKDRIAAAIGRRHSEATGAPAFFVQVVIEESDTRRYIGGELSGAHIWIRGDIRSGRPEAVRSALMLAIMKDVSAIAGIPEASIWVYLCNLEPTDMVEFGHVLPSPGSEQLWFESLPAGLQTYLSGLGAKRETFRL